MKPERRRCGKRLYDPVCHFIFVVLLLLLSACSHQPHVVEQSDISVPGSIDLYIIRQGWHTGLIIPAGVIQSRLPQLYERFADTPYLEFGWGDRDYYENEKVTFGMTVKAVFLPTQTVVRVIAIPDRPDIHFSDVEVQSVCVDADHYARLLEFIENSFLTDDAGNILDSKDGYDGNSHFYKGVGDYYLMNTCNTWTARGLKTAGLDISPAFKISAGSIMGYLSKQQKGEPLPACP